MAFSKIKLYLIVISIAFCVRKVKANVDIPGTPENNDFTTPEKIEFDGYPVITMEVVTEDGYINIIHRIPPKIKPARAVILQHGLQSSSADWVMNIPSNNLAYILHDQGWDVWLPNFRGNKYSRKHTTLDPNATASIGSGFTGYWDFSYHEMGIYDLPAVIDLVLAADGQPQVYYIGHSMGTTTYFVMCSEKPEYRDKIRYAILASPVAYTQHLISPIRVIATLLIPGAQPIIELVGPGEFTPSGTLLSRMEQIACNSLAPELCKNLFFILFGYDAEQYNITMQPIYIAQFPAGSSAKATVHFAQGVNGKNFRPFDDSLLGSNPPLPYNLKNVNAPMAFLYGDNDWLAATKDVLRLADAVRPNYVNNPDNFQLIHIDHEKWNHVDFILAIDVVSLAYNAVVELLDSH